MSYDFVTYKCAWCNKRFIPNHVGHKFCCTECCQAENREFGKRYRQRTIIEKAQLLLARQEAGLLCDAIDRHYGLMRTLTLYPIKVQEWTKPDLRKLKAALKGKDHRLTIMFDGKPLLVGYGRYVVEYLEGMNLPE